jgi:hypothetical protein
MSDPTPAGNSTKTTENGPPPADLRSALLDRAGDHGNDLPDRQPPSSSGVQLWMHRTSVFLFVLISAVAGVLLIILPWTPEWTDNSLLLSYPSLRLVVANGFFRGICSGLGLLDIWIGFWEALHYHEHH